MFWERVYHPGISYTISLELDHLAKRKRKVKLNKQGKGWAWLERCSQDVRKSVVDGMKSTDSKWRALLTNSIPMLVYATK